MVCVTTMPDLDSVLRWIGDVLDARKAQEITSCGCYEIPYATSCAPRRPDKRGTKWADLVAVHRDHAVSLWFELKDLGRSQNRLALNAKHAGIDLAMSRMISKGLE